VARTHRQGEDRRRGPPLAANRWKRRLQSFEIYVPKRAAYLSGLCRFLHRAVATRDPIRLDGFTVYEVDGAYRGCAGPCEERVCVVRLILPTAIAEARTPNPSVLELGRRVLRITRFKEEQVWIVRYCGCEVFSFRGADAQGSRGGLP
jgi:hypothetical protein